MKFTVLWGGDYCKFRKTAEFMFKIYSLLISWPLAANKIIQIKIK